jgi:hypothetical protein
MMISFAPVVSSWRPAQLVCTLLLTLVTTTAPVMAGVITAVDPGTVVTDKLINFSGISGISPVDTTLNIDTILDMDGASFAEHFQGQTLGTGTISNHDSLSGVPDNPLTLVPGASNQNLVLVGDITDAVLAGNGPDAHPNNTGIGEGAVSFLFDSDVSDFVIDGVGFYGGEITFLFFGRDGSDLGMIGSTPGGVNATFAFRSSGTSIAGVSVFNLDEGGIGLDNLAFSFDTTPIPEPSSCCLALIGTGFALSFFRKQRRLRMHENRRSGSQSG